MDEDWQGEIEEVSSMEAIPPATRSEEGGKVIPFWLQSKLTEVGTLGPWSVDRGQDRRWNLEFRIR